MARYINEDATFWRFKLVTYDPHGNQDGKSEYFGPYSSKGVAKGQRSRELSRLRRSVEARGGKVRGHLEKAVVEWVEIDVT